MHKEQPGLALSGSAELEVPSLLIFSSFINALLNLGSAPPNLAQSDFSSHKNNIKPTSTISRRTPPPSSPTLLQILQLPNPEIKDKWTGILSVALPNSWTKKLDGSHQHR